MIGHAVAAKLGVEPWRVSSATYLKLGGMSVPRELECFIDAQVAANPMPGLACAAVVGDGFVWTYGSGWADIERQTPMDGNTIMNIASVSKPVTATAVLRLWEETGFDLDADVSTLTGFDVHNPHHPNAVITTRQLLAHRSSIKDGPAYEAGYVCGRPSLDLESWLRTYFLPTNRQAIEDANFHRWAPGTVNPPESPRPYSNVGYGVLSLLVEKVSGISFDDYCQDRIFAPLGMQTTSWFLKGIHSSVMRVYIRSHPTTRKNGDLAA